MISLTIFEKIGNNIQTDIHTQNVAHKCFPRIDHIYTLAVSVSYPIYQFSLKLDIKQLRFGLFLKITKMTLNTRQLT